MKKILEILVGKKYSYEEEISELEELLIPTNRKLLELV